MSRTFFSFSGNVARTTVTTGVRATLVFELANEGTEAIRVESWIEFAQFMDCNVFRECERMRVWDCGENLGDDFEVFSGHVNLSAEVSDD